jgi:hypothetical protein
MHLSKMRTTSSIGLLSLLLCVPQLQAQGLTRSFISGLGSDTNPCTRALPCQTLSGALANTAGGGEIDILDGAELISTSPLFIGKSVSIVGAGARGGVTGGLIISPPTGGQVLLKNLAINANNQVGVSVTTSVGISLVIEDCTIVNGIVGINFAPQASTATSYLVVRNSTIENNAPSGSFAGIFVQPGSPGPSFVVLDGVHLNSNKFGIWAFDYATVTIRNSVASQNTASGIRAESTSSAGPATILVEHSQSSHNHGNGVVAVGTAVVRISDLTVTDNLSNGVVAVSGGQVISFGNNSIDGNVNNGTPTSTIALK